jgi:hypothetical protein
VAAINLIVTINFLRRKIRARATRFPKAEMASLGTLLAIMTGQIFVRAKVSPIDDPVCAQAYSISLLIVLIALSYSSVRGLIQDCATFDWQKKGR